MAVAAATVESYDNTLIIDDLRRQYSMISPEQTPFQTAAGVGEGATATYHEWNVVKLAAPDTANRVPEGEDAPGLDNGTLGVRLGNHTQISDKVISVSSTSNAVDAAASNIQREAAQIAIKMKELKRDMEAMFLQNISASAGSSGTARQSAGLPNFIRSNVVLGAGGAVASLSGGTTGFPNSAVTPGTAVALTEDNLNLVIQRCWDAGADPTIIMVGSNNKRVISKNFTGNATRYKDVIDKRLSAAIDVYDSDFGELSVVPNRFIQTLAANTFPVYVLDPEYAEINFLQTMKQEPLAKTGHANRRMLSCEYCLTILNEEAHGMITATNGAFV